MPSECGLSNLVVLGGWQEPDSIPSNVVIRNKKKDKHDQAAGCGAGAGKLVV